MPNEAFALSPISARAASPTDADFDAIREAFLETARGRWFLDEYTRRNRNADTAMVLEAVARIEQSLAAQKEEQRLTIAEQPSGEAPASEEQASNELPEAMAAVRAILAAARDSVASVLAGPAIEEMLAPSRKCARVIREIAWGLRESGADGRICALLESQVEAINLACDQASAGGLHDGVMHAFDRAARQIAEIVPSARVETSEAVIAENISTAEHDIIAVHPAPERMKALVLNDDIRDAHALAEESALEPIVEAALPADDVPAMEFANMPASFEATPEPAAVIVQAEIAVTAPQHDITIQPAMEIAPEPVAEIAPVSTLGESLIASGIVAKPATPRSDPLAPIRRMSLAEKVAFFS